MKYLMKQLILMGKQKKEHGKCMLRQEWLMKQIFTENHA